MVGILDEIIRQQREHTERTLAEIIKKYDFAVGSMELKHIIMERLPEGANIICSPYIEDPTKIYAIKKFDIEDLSFESEENEDDCKGCYYYGGVHAACVICDKFKEGVIKNECKTESEKV